MATKKRKKKAQINWLAWLSIVLVANVAAGLLFSKVTSAINIRVIGARQFDQARIELVLAELKDQPMMRVSAASVVSELSRPTYIRTAEFQSNLFGRGLVKLVYVTPIAKIKGINSTYLGQDGELIYTPETIVDIPELSLFPEALQPNLAYTCSWDSKGIARIAMMSVEILKDAKPRISLDSRGIATIGLTQNRSIVLGSTSEITEKFSKLQSILKGNPDVLRPGAEINLTAPARPVISNGSTGG